LNASNIMYTATPSWIWTAMEANHLGTHKKIHNFAVGGDTIAGQTTLLNASAYKIDGLVKWAFLQAGINDIGGGMSAADFRTAYQAQVDAVRAGNSGIKIVCGTITPAWGYWNTTYGGAGADAREAVRLAVNTSIMNGASPITDCDSRVDGYLAGLTHADTKSLIAVCDTGTGVNPADGIHYNDQCKKEIVAAAVRTAVTAYGF
jgi:lysophospholipase L1-like esterase